MEVGNKVVVDGKEAVITGRHASGKHVQWSLDDGRVVADLHLRKDVQTSSGMKKKESKKRVWQHEPISRLKPDVDDA